MRKQELDYLHLFTRHRYEAKELPKVTILQNLSSNKHVMLHCMFDDLTPFLNIELDEEEVCVDLQVKNHVVGTAKDIDRALGSEDYASHCAYSSKFSGKFFSFYEKLVGGFGLEKSLLRRRFCIRFVIRTITENAACLTITPAASEDLPTYFATLPSISGSDIDLFIYDIYDQESLTNTVVLRSRLKAKIKKALLVIEQNLKEMGVDYFFLPGRHALR